MHKCRIYDHFTVWPSSETLAFNLTEQLFQMALLLLKEHNCVILFWNPCINVEDIARTSSIIWPSVMTLTFSLPEQMFQVALLLPKKNNYARLFWNPCINIEDMARTSSIYWPFYHLTFKCDLDLPHTWINVSNGTATPQREQLCQIILKSMHKCRSYGWDKRNICDLQVWHWPSTYLKCFKLHFFASWRQLCQIILKSMHKCRSYGLDQSGLMHARTHALMHARTYTEKKL